MSWRRVGSKYSKKPKICNAGRLISFFRIWQRSKFLPWLSTSSSKRSMILSNPKVWDDAMVIPPLLPRDAADRMGCLPKVWYIIPQAVHPGKKKRAASSAEKNPGGFSLARLTKRGGMGIIDAEGRCYDGQPDRYTNDLLAVRVASGRLARFCGKKHSQQREAHQKAQQRIESVFPHLQPPPPILYSPRGIHGGPTAVCNSASSVPAGCGALLL